MPRKSPSAPASSPGTANRWFVTGRLATLRAEGPARADTDVHAHADAKEGSDA
jgi:hypothetical protein